MPVFDAAEREVLEGLARVYHRAMAKHHDRKAASVYKKGHYPGSMKRARAKAIAHVGKADLHRSKVK